MLNNDDAITVVLMAQMELATPERIFKRNYGDTRV